jgi:hypothetical protein
LNALPSQQDTPTDIPVYATVKKPARKELDSPRQRTTSGSPFSTPGASTPSFGQPYTPVTTSPAGSPNTMVLRVKYLEELCGKLSQEKSKMEEGFGRQRKSFMNQMAECDGELSRYRHSVEKYKAEVQELSSAVLKKDEELQNVTITAGITEATIRERFDADRIKYEEEIASLTKIVAGEFKLVLIGKYYSELSS